MSQVKALLDKYETDSACDVMLASPEKKFGIIESKRSEENYFKALITLWMTLKCNLLGHKVA